MIPHSRTTFDAACVAAVGRVVQGGHTARGPVSETLEARVATLTDSREAVAVDSGSSALMLALYALARRAPLARVGIPAYACRALLHAVRAVGAMPVFMDCGEDLRLDPAHAEQCAPQLDAVILVHPFGMIEPLVAEAWPCPVIEDIAQAAGGSYRDEPLGGFGDVGVASFYATKPWGGAYGGMVVSDDSDITGAVRTMRHADSAGVELAYAGNHQLSDVHAALAMGRLDAAGEEMRLRRKLAARFDGYLEGGAARRIDGGETANHFRYIVRVADADRTIEALHAAGVGAARPVEVPLSALCGEACSGAETARRECVSLPIPPNLSDEEEHTMQQALSTCL